MQVPQNLYVPSRLLPHAIYPIHRAQLLSLSSQLLHFLIESVEADMMDFGRAVGRFQVASSASVIILLLQMASLAIVCTPKTAVPVSPLVIACY